MAVGCQKPAPFKLTDSKPRSDREAPFDPAKNYPEWAYDKPSYVKATTDLQPEPRAREEDPLHYFTNKKLVPIRQPGGYKPEEVPRVAVWYTDNNGFDWQRAGYLGRIETYYWFDAPGDGDYGIRFVGPGQEPAKVPVAEPVRVYHVDTTLPDVELMVDPNQAWYQPGQTVVITWKAHDYHLKEQPVEIGLSVDFSSEHPSWTVLQKDLEAEGSYSYTIPSDAAERGLTFRVAALDRAGNLGMAFSHLIQVTGDKTTASADSQPPPQSLAMPTAAMSPPAPAASTSGDSAPTEIQVEGRVGALELDKGATIAAPSDMPAPSPVPTGWTPINASAPAAAPQPAMAGTIQGQEAIEPIPELQIDAGQPKNTPPAATNDSRLPDADVLFESQPSGSHEASSALPPSDKRESADAPLGPPVIRRATVEAVAEPPAPSVDRHPTVGATINPNPSAADLIPEMESKETAPSAAPQQAPAPGSSRPAQIPTRTKKRSDRTTAPSNGSLSPHSLVPPLPATVTGDPHVASASRRPWQSLSSEPAAQQGVVWQLPRPAFMNDSADLFELQFGGVNRDLIPAAPGADTNRPLATLDDFGNPKILPAPPGSAP